MSLICLNFILKGGAFIRPHMTTQEAKRIQDMWRVGNCPGTFFGSDPVVGMEWSVLTAEIAAMHTVSLEDVKAQLQHQMHQLELAQQQAQPWHIQQSGRKN